MKSIRELQKSYQALTNPAFDKIFTIIVLFFIGLVFMLGAGFIGFVWIYSAVFG